MHLLPLLPSLITGLAVSASDIRSRRVPLPWIGAGLTLQLAALAAWAWHGGNWTPLATGIALGSLSALAQLLLATVRPGALGFGDVTATALVGLAVGSLGPTATALWWLLMGLLGLTALGVAHASTRIRGNPPRRHRTPIRNHNGARHDGEHREHTTGAKRTDASIPFAPVILMAGVLSCLSTLW